ncbi:hypothetical protein RCL1_006887 [Eukaryota sp. TZLM3-RCL]
MASRSDELWAKIEAGRQYDLELWEKYITVLEQENDLDRLIQAGEDLLRIFPLLHIFWTKYASWVFKKDNDAEQTVSIFETAVLKCPYVPQMWLSFSEFILYNKVEIPNPRNVLSRAVSKVGLFTNAVDLWEKWVIFEGQFDDTFDETVTDDFFSTPNFDHSAAMVRSFSLLLCSLVVPLNKSALLFSRCKELISNLAVEDLHRGAVLAVQIGTALKFPSNFQSELESLSTSLRQMTSSDLIFDRVYELYQQTESVFKAKQPFEVPLSRQWYTIKPLPEAQLVGWRQYLLNEIKISSFEYVVSLFNRCLVPCADFLEFWVMFINYCNQNNRPRHVFERLMTCHEFLMTSSPDFRLITALQLEEIGDEPAALQVYEILTQLFETSPLVVARFASFCARRQFPIPQWLSLLEKKVAQSPTSDQKNALTLIAFRLLWSNYYKSNLEEVYSTTKKILSETRGPINYWVEVFSLSKLIPNFEGIFWLLETLKDFKSELGPEFFVLIDIICEDVAITSSPVIALKAQSFKY